MNPVDERDYVEYVSARLPVLRRAAYLLSGDRHRTDDVVQATTTELYRRWRRIRAVDNLPVLLINTLADLAQQHIDGCSRCVLKRIREQIIEHLGQPHAIALDGRRCFQIHIYIQIFMPGAYAGDDIP